MDYCYDRYSGMILNGYDTIAVWYRCRWLWYSQFIAMIMMLNSFITMILLYYQLSIINLIKVFCHVHDVIDDSAAWYFIALSTDTHAVWYSMVLLLWYSCCIILNGFITTILNINCQFYQHMNQYYRDKFDAFKFSI